MIDDTVAHSGNNVYNDSTANIARELTYAFEIDGKAATKLKREIEKKNHFC